MIEPGGDPDLPEKPLRAQRGGQFRTQHLQRDTPIVFQVVGQMHCGHPTATDLPLNQVSAGESGLHAVERSSHWSQSCGSL
jgi:hypothetical protein